MKKNRNYVNEQLLCFVSSKDPSRQLCSTGNLLGNPLVSFPDLHGIDSASAGDDEEVVEEVGSGEELGAQCKFECKRVDYKAR